MAKWLGLVLVVALLACAIPAQAQTDKDVVTWTFPPGRYLPAWQVYTAAIGTGAFYPIRVSFNGPVVVVSMYYDPVAWDRAVVINTLICHLKYRFPRSWAYIPADCSWMED